MLPQNMNCLKSALSSDWSNVPIRWRQMVVIMALNQPKVVRTIPAKGPGGPPWLVKHTVYRYIFTYTQ